MADPQRTSSSFASSPLLSHFCWRKKLQAKTKKLRLYQKRYLFFGKILKRLLRTKTSTCIFQVRKLERFEVRTILIMDDFSRSFLLDVIGFGRWSQCATPFEGAWKPYDVLTQGVELIWINGNVWKWLVVQITRSHKSSWLMVLLALFKLVITPDNSFSPQGPLSTVAV